MATTLQDYRDHARLHLDIEEEDLVNALVDQWLRQRFEEVTRLVRDWSFYETSEQITTASGITEYELTTVALPSAIQGLNNVGTLKPIETATAFARYHPAGFPGHAGRPSAYSYTKRTRTVRIWPEPDGEYELTVRGFREPSYAWLDDPGSPPDLPDQFHGVLLHGLMADVFEWDDDLERSARREGKFNEALDRMTTDDQASLPHTGPPLVLGGRRTRRTLGRPVSDLEFLSND